MVSRISSDFSKGAAQSPTSYGEKLGTAGLEDTVSVTFEAFLVMAMLVYPPLKYSCIILHYP